MRSILITLSFCLFSIFVSAAVSAERPLLPPDGKTLLFIGQDNDTILNYTRETGHTPYGFMLYTSVHEAKSLNEPWDYGAGRTCADEIVEKYPGAALQIGLYMVGSLDGIIAGAYDANIDKIGRWIKDARVPVYLRIGYEFDMPENGYDPEKFKAAWRIIVDRFRSLNVENAAYVWHSQATSEPNGEIESWYPGDNYVDWVGVSIFNTAQLPRAKAILDFARARDKPFMIAESSPAGLYLLPSRLDWFRKVFRFVEENDVEAFSYINSHWDAMPMFKDIHWGDARVETSEPVKKLFLENVTSGRYAL